MSKIGRQPILLSSAKVEIVGNRLTIQGSKDKFVHELPEEIHAAIDGKFLKLTINENTRQNRMFWGLHRALLMNKVKGVEQGFEKKITIVGLGYKAALAGKKLTFTLGYTNKIDYELPQGVTVDIDKTGQLLVVKAADKFVLGNVCDMIRSFRPPEPYKGTGVIREHDVIMRKAGKTKSAA